MLFLVLGFVSEFLRQDINQVVNLVHETPLKVFKLFAVSLALKRVCQLGEAILHLALQVVEIALEHGQ